MNAVTEKSFRRDLRAGLTETLEAKLAGRGSSKPEWLGA